MKTLCRLSLKECGYMQCDMHNFGVTLFRKRSFISYTIQKIWLTREYSFDFFQMKCRINNIAVSLLEP